MLFPRQKRICVFQLACDSSKIANIFNHAKNHAKHWKQKSYSINKNNCQTCCWHAFLNSYKARKVGYLMQLRKSHRFAETIIEWNKRWKPIETSEDTKWVSWMIPCLMLLWDPRRVIVAKSRLNFSEETDWESAVWTISMKMIANSLLIKNYIHNRKRNVNYQCRIRNSPKRRERKTRMEKEVIAMTLFKPQT